MDRPQGRKPAIVLNAIISKLQMVAGAVIGGFFVIAFIVSLSEPTMKGDVSFLIFTLVVIVLCVLLFWNGWKRSKLVKLFRQYAALLSQEPNRSIQYLADRLGTPREQVTAQLERMIYKKFFVNAYIDHASGCIVFPSQDATTCEEPGGSDAFGPSGEGASVSGGSSGWVPVICGSCGASGRIREGAGGQCEYCGSPLRGN